MSYDNQQVLLGGFSDEAAIDKTLDQQFAAFAAIGLDWLTIRFVDAGSGVKNVMNLEPAEIELVKQKLAAYDLRVSCIGSPIGKVKLRDVDDGTQNKFIPFDQYLENDVRRACELAQSLGAKLIRGFSFYHPKDSNVEEHLNQATDQLGQITERCAQYNLVFGLEVETNLIGYSGQILKRIHQAVNHANMKLVFDGGNLVTQGYTTDEVFREYLAMKPGLGWLHVKDYRNADTSQRGAYIDEEALDQYVPATLGQSGYAEILKDVAASLPEFNDTMQKLGVPGFFIDLEPHVKGGGQFGGFSGPDGFGIALRELTKLLDLANLPYHLRDFQSVSKV